MKSLFKKILSSKTSVSSKQLDSQILVIYLGEKKIGSLCFDGSSYTFEYENGISIHERLVGVNSGTTKYLAPYFCSRIPNTERPEVASEIKKYSQNLIHILGTLGKESAISPYRFELAAI